jgi:septum formation protein
MTQANAQVQTQMLVLASRSPRRSDILREMGYAFVVDSADVDESVVAGESPRDHVLRMATTKCLRVAARHPHEDVVLAADTTVDVDGEIFGTPRDTEHARAMLRRLSGRTHLVHTAVCVARGMHESSVSSARGDAHDVALDTASVTMHPIAPDALERYLTTGESLDTAGAYALQGEAAVFVRELYGERSTVVGLPVPVVRRLLDRHGVAHQTLGLSPDATRP